jgi:phenylacetate-CoA ligase
MIQSSGTPPIPRTVAAIVGGGSDAHDRQVAANVSVGIHNARTLPGTLPIERLVEELNRFGPNHMNAFPSVAAILADVQISGRLCISLTTAMNCAPFSQLWDCE